MIIRQTTIGREVSCRETNDHACGSDGAVELAFSCRIPKPGCVPPQCFGRECSRGAPSPKGPLPDMHVRCFVVQAVEA
jgi:hypothetical protein